MNEILQPQKSKVLVIDDDPGITSLIQEGAESRGYTVVCVNDFDQILPTCMKFKPDIVFLDLRLRSHDGIEVLHSLSNTNSNAAIYIVSGMDKATLKAAGNVGKANNLNIKGTISKPFLIEDIEKILLDRDGPESSFSSSIWNEAMNSRGEFVTYYRPKMAIETSAGSAIAALESVVCWVSQQGKVLYPYDFMPLVLNSGHLRLFSQTAFEKIMTDFKYWIDRDLEFDLSVNLDQAMFSDIQLPDTLASIVMEWGIPYNRITFGIPHEIASAQTDVLLDILTRIRIKGFGLTTRIASVDENTLAELFNLPVSEIKVAGSLLKGIHDDMDKEFDIHSMILTAKKRGFKTCVAGIETAALFNFAYECGCTYGQGQYFSGLLQARQIEGFAYGRSSFIDSPSSTRKVQGQG